MGRTFDQRTRDLRPKMIYWALKSADYNRDDAEDIVAKAILKAWREYPKAVALGVPFQAFMRVRVRSAVLEFFARRRRRGEQIPAIAEELEGRLAEEISPVWSHRSIDPEVLRVYYLECRRGVPARSRRCIPDEREDERRREAVAKVTPDERQSRSKAQQVRYRKTHPNARPMGVDRKLNVDWSAVRGAWATGRHSYPELAAMFGIGKAAIYSRATRGDWVRDDDAQGSPL